MPERIRYLPPGVTHHVSPEEEAGPWAVPEPAHRPEHFVRRVSRDGLEEYVDPEYLKPAKKGPALFRKRADRPGRRWDHLRTKDPVIISPARYGGLNPTDPSGRWRYLVETSPGWVPPERRHVVPREELDEMMPNWAFDPEKASVHRNVAPPVRPKTSVGDFLFRGPWAPVLFRLIVLSTTIAALAESVIIFKKMHVEETRESAKTSVAEEKAQAIVAIAVDAVAIPYLVYMLAEDVHARPVRLGSVVNKAMLILMDLFFIIFKAVGTGLAFEALAFRSSGPDQSLDSPHAWALAMLMLVGLLFWTLNFTISVLRLVEKLGGGHGDGRG